MASMDARTFYDDEQRAQVAKVVADAEARTAAEFVCVVATESGRYDRAEDLVGLTFGLCGLWAATTLGVTEPGWGQAAPLGWQALGVVAGYVVGTVAASHLHVLRKPWVSRKEQSAEVSRAAGALFRERRLTSTRQRAGIMIYVSLFEQQVRVLADEGAYAVLKQEGVDEMRDLTLEGLRARDVTKAFTLPIEAAVDALAEGLPRQPDDANEHPDAVLCLHPRP